MNYVNSNSCRMCGTYSVGSFETLCQECKRTQAIIDSSKQKDKIMDTLKAKADAWDEVSDKCKNVSNDLELLAVPVFILYKAKELSK